MYLNGTCKTVAECYIVDIKYMVGSETVRYLRITLCKLIENKTNTTKTQKGEER